MYQTTNRNGKTVTLLNPAEKRAKFNRESKEGFKRTNDGKYKKGEDGKAIKLTEEEKIWRAGYNAACIDAGKAYYANKSGKRRGK